MILRGKGEGWKEVLLYSWEGLRELKVKVIFIACLR